MDSRTPIVATTLARPLPTPAPPPPVVERRPPRWLAGSAAAVALVAITALGALLRFQAFGHVNANPYYDAAVRSMALNWHNFFVGAAEPAAGVSVDKIPFDLWLQVASVKLFGFSSTALRLPEALAATAAIPLLYDLIRRLFGSVAGLVAALALGASGRRSAVELNPNSFTDATWSQRSKGILSTDTPAAGSAAPTKKLCQFSAMLRTAAS